MSDSGMLEILYKRRSIRSYKPEKIEEEKVQTLLKAALLSPTSHNSRPWEFIVVDDPEKLAQLAPAKRGSQHLKGAVLAIVVLADPEASDVWVEDTSIAAAILHLTAESLGLGSCWIQIRQRPHSETESAEDYVRRILGIPAGRMVDSIIAFGYPNETRRPHTEEELKALAHKVHLNAYGNSADKS